MGYAPENCFRPTKDILGHVGPFWAIWVLFWAIWGPCGHLNCLRLVQKIWQILAKWHVIMSYIPDNCFRTFGTLPGRHLACASISPSGHVGSAKKKTRKIFIFFFAAAAAPPLHFISITHYDQDRLCSLDWSSWLLWEAFCLIVLCKSWWKKFHRPLFPKFTVNMDKNHHPNQLYVFISITEGHWTIAHVHYVHWAVSPIEQSKFYM